MYQYAVKTDIEEERFFSAISEISQDLQRLQNEAGAFVVLEVSPPINYVNYIQAANLSDTKGFFKKRHVITGYIIELNMTERDGSLTHYEYETKDFEEIEEILVEYISLLKTPNFSAWTDVSKHLFG